jgi:hypothetical protein
MQIEVTFNFIYKMHYNELVNFWTCFQLLELNHSLLINFIPHLL